MKDIFSANAIVSKGAQVSSSMTFHVNSLEKAEMVTVELKFSIARSISGIFNDPEPNIPSKLFHAQTSRELLATYF